MERVRAAMRMEALAGALVLVLLAAGFLAGRLGGGDAADPSAVATTADGPGRDQTRYLVEVDSSGGAARAGGDGATTDGGTAGASEAGGTAATDARDGASGTVSRPAEGPASAASEESAVGTGTDMDRDKAEGEATPAGDAADVGGRDGTMAGAPRKVIEDVSEAEVEDLVDDVDLSATDRLMLAQLERRGRLGLLFPSRVHAVTTPELGEDAVAETGDTGDVAAADAADDGGGDGPEGGSDGPSAERAGVLTSARAVAARIRGLEGVSLAEVVDDRHVAVETSLEVADLAAVPGVIDVRPDDTALRATSTTAVSFRSSHRRPSADRGVDGTSGPHVSGNGDADGRHVALAP